MKLWKKILLALLVLVLISQIPFAYRRYQLGKLNAAILSLQSQRQMSSSEDGLLEVVGVSHVHSFLGGHSSGTFQEIVAAANANKLNFVLMSEHPAKEFDTSAMTLKGEHGGIIFINGNEVVTGNGDRLLMFPGSSDAYDANKIPTQDYLARHQEAVSFAAYPDEYKGWDAEPLDGIEVYNVYTNARKINSFVLFFDGLWSYRSYPHLLFVRFYEKPVEALKRWDQETVAGTRRVAVAGNDAHANVGFNLRDSSGNPVAGIQLDPYARSFRLVRMHLLLKLPLTDMLNESQLLDALAHGHAFIGFDVFGDSGGFRFEARDENEHVIMGDEITMNKDLKFRVSVPVPAHIVLLKDGVKFKEESNARTLESVATEKGSYRVEVYLPQLAKQLVNNPWIISNPIYVR
jgi:hypothetical protein